MRVEVTSAAQAGRTRYVEKISNKLSKTERPIVDCQYRPRAIHIYKNYHTNMRAILFLPTNTVDSPRDRLRDVKSTDK